MKFYHLTLKFFYSKVSQLHKLNKNFWKQTRGWLFLFHKSFFENANLAFVDHF